MELERLRSFQTVVTFPLVDADGDTVSGAAALDSEITSWNDGSTPGAFGDCTNEATEIGTTGVYYLTVTAAEMDADYIAVQVKATGVKTQHILITTTRATGILHRGTAQAVGPGTITLAAANPFAEDEINDCLVLIEGAATGNRQIRVVTDFAAGTDIASISPNWTTTPTGTIRYAIIASPPTTATLETRLAELDAGNIPTDLASIQSDTDDIQSRLPAALVSGRMDASVGAMVTDVISAAALAATAVNEIRDAILSDATPFAGALVANLDAAVTTRADAAVYTAGRGANLDNLDVAVTTRAATGAAMALTAAAVDAIWDEVLVEIGVGVPPATPAARGALMLLYMALRNERTSTATEDSISNDAGTKIAEADLSDAAGVFTKGEYRAPT